MIDSLFAQLEKHLSQPTPVLASFISQTVQSIKDVTGDERVRATAILRLLRGIDSREEKRASTTDVIILLRQVLRWHARLSVHSEWWKPFRPLAGEFGVYDRKLAGSDLVQLWANDWQPSWLTDKDEIDQLAFRRDYHPVIGDGSMYRFFEKKNATYYSDGQKLAVDAWMFAPSGSTTLITLATGGGKSVCTLLPPFVETRGGTVKGGMTLVIVPTVALALDQQSRAQEYFASATYAPAAIHGATKSAERSRIAQAVTEGQCPVLFLSPESLLLNPILYDSCLKAAKAGFLKRLVIDEAHLIETWGASFRIEFQLLATYRQQLMQESDNQLKTCLMSATISDNARNLLTDLFATHGALRRVEFNQMRPEISYWVARMENESMQREQVTEALRFLPRPAILYVTRPSEAEEWKVHLQDELKLRRLATFTGSTQPDERDRLLSKWLRDEIDVMIATSAFGLGVDKADVRTVIHATLPESVDRYYQEVGRSGRDGYRSISLLCATPKDKEFATRMSLGQRITTEKAWQRWNSMHRTATPTSLNRILISLNARPDYNMDGDESDFNRDWNGHTLVLMQRAKLISIDQLRPTNETSAEDRHQIGIRVFGSAATSNHEAFIQHIAPHRDAEIARLVKQVEAMKDLTNVYTKAPKHCMARHLAQPYLPIGMACGGCPACRANTRTVYSESPRVQIVLKHDNTSAPDIELQTRIGAHGTLILHWDKLEWSLDDLAPLLAALVERGFVQLVIADYWLTPTAIAELLEELAKPAFTPHRIIPSSWLQTYRLQDILFALPTVILYPPHAHDADELYQHIKRWQGSVWQTHLIPAGLYLTSEQGAFIDRVQGMVQSGNAWFKWHRQQRY